MTVPSRVAIVGGGIAGLTAAYRIQKLAAERDADVEVHVYEAGGTVGGKIRSRRDDEWLCESGPNGFLDNEPATLRLVDDLGLRDQLLRSSDAARRRFLVRKGQLVEMHMHPIRFLKSPLLSRRAKLRMAMEYFKPARRDGGDESVGDFGRRRLGREFTEVMLDSMVSGIYAGDVDRLSVAAAFPRIVELEQTYGGLFKGMLARQKERRKRLREAKRRGKTQTDKAGDRPVQAGPSGVLHSFTEGMQAPIDALAEALGPQVLHTRSRIAGLRRGRRFELETAAGERIEADAVIVALPSLHASGLLEELSPEAASALGGVELAGVHVVCLGFPEEQIAADTAAFGVLIPRREKIRTLGSIFSSATFSGRAPEGQVLLTNMIGGRHDPQASDLDDDALVAQVLADLRPVLGLHGEPSYLRVYRWARGIPQYELGHLERVARAERAVAGLPGLHLAGNSVVGVSFNQCILAAESLAPRVLDELAGSSSQPETSTANTGESPS
jgi:oxygen-dependent protoporphyrinogen oxidase